MRTLVASALLSAAALVALPAVSSEAAARPSCHGHRASLVGKPKGFVQGTRRADVIVSNGATDVSGAGGDDLICVTGSAREVSVSGGSGDDRVYVVSTRSQVGFFGATGSDTYVGNGRDDSVGFLADGIDRATTGKGDDRLFLNMAKKPLRDGRFDLGTGDDLLSLKTKNNPVDAVTADLTAHKVILGRTSGGPTYGFKPRGVEDVETNNFVFVDLVGDEDANTFVAFDGCQVTMAGMAGDDLLSTGLTETPEDCAATSTTLADGGEGTDSCYATTYISCEVILPHPAVVG